MLASQPPPLVRDVLLRDGSTLRLQASTPEDFEDIKAFYDRLSPDSRHSRFHGSGRTDLVARDESEAIGRDRLSLIGRLYDRVVAVASYNGLREHGVAEVAFAVADDLQKRGIGMRMLEQLATIAAVNGIHRFDAEVMSDNRSMLAVCENAGFAVRRRGSFGEVTVSLDITPTEAVRERIGERDHVAAVAALQSILAPSSIAVVGAAATPGNVGGTVLANILRSDFQGVVTPVNRAGGIVQSMQSAHSLGELSVASELVIVAASGDELLELAGEAAASGARALLVLPRGPEDDGESSPEQEERLLEVLRGAGLRMVGQSSMGVLNTSPEVCMNATLSGASVLAGGLAIGSHAVSLGLGLLAHAAARQLGVSIMIALGSRVDVSTSDLLEWCEDDERTTVVMLYVETFGDPERFMRVAQRVSRTKPILVVKGSRRGQRARTQAQTQTATALRDDAVFDAVLRHAGVLRFRSGEELFQTAELFESQPLPDGREIGIISNSRAAAMLAADAITSYGLQVSEASQAQNPMVLGVGAGPEEYAAGLRELLADPGIDALIVSYVDHQDGDPEAVLDAISTASRDLVKPVVASVVRSDGRSPERTRQQVPNFLFPESCAAALASAAERRAWLSRPLGERPSYPDLDAERARDLTAAFLQRAPAGGWLELDDLEALLATHGIAVAASHRCKHLDHAIAAAHAVAGPVALKADLAPPAHASEIHAVLLGLEGDSAVRSGWRELQRRVRAAGREWIGAIVQRLAEPGADVLVGSVRDADLGTVIAVGLGGRQAALGETVAFRLPPSTDVEADELIDSCRSVRSELDGLLGGSTLDRIALRELILRFAKLLIEVPELAETDLNSVRCMPSGCTVLDMRARIAPPRPIDRVKTW